MNEKKCIFCTDRRQWREWLSEHFETESEIWFVFPSVNSGEKGVSYNDAVEEALCFGWIDGQAGTLDESHQLRRFTPRRKGSGYSRPNIERLIYLDSRGLIHPKIRASVEEIISRPFVFPEDILDEIRRDSTAWENYQSFSEPYRRIRVAYIDAARKRPEEFKKRLDNFIRKTRENKLIIGYGGIEKYYRTDPQGREPDLKQLFESDRIRFAEVSELLINDYLTMVNDYENVNRYIGGKRKAFTEEQERAWVQEKLAEKAPVYSMIDKVSGRFIGNIELMDLTETEAELGIAITAEMQNLGYGTEAVSAMVRYAFDHFGLKRVFLRTNPDNDRAIRVYEKCGFREYDRSDKHVYMEIFRDNHNENHSL